MKRTANIEMMLFDRQVVSVVNPAARAYAAAIANAVRAGCTSLTGSRSVETVKRLLNLDVAAQGVGEDFFVSPNDWGDVLERVAQDTLRLCLDKDPRGIKLAVMFLHVAETLNVQRPAIADLQALVDEVMR